MFNIYMFYFAPKKDLKWPLGYVKCNKITRMRRRNRVESQIGGRNEANKKM